MPMRAWAILAAAAALAAQSAPEPSSVAGVVTNSVTSEPILRAHVMLQCWSQDSQQQTYGALTNEKGGFSLSSLPPAGHCNLQAEHVGFVAPPNGGAPINLTSGTHRESIKLTLTPTGAITGRVTNAAGEPAQGVDVSVDSGEFNMGNGNVTTDEKGQFRIGGLRPGKYRVKASPQKMPFPPEIRADGSAELQDATTYYPSSLDAKTAQRQEVKAGAEVSGVDIKLIQVPIVLVSGKVDGIPAGAKNVSVMTQPQGQPGRVKSDGSFSLWRLDPGKYTLQAMRWEGQSPLLSAPVEIEVTSANLEHIDLRMIPPFDIPGQLRFDDEQAREAPKPPKRRDGANTPAPQPHMVQLQPLQMQFVGGSNARAEADDSFTLSKVQPARYRIAIQGVSGYVQSLRVGDTDVTGNILDVRNGSAGPLTVTLSSNYCEISGTVSDSSGPSADARVALASEENQSGVRWTKSDATGAYKFRVPPGKYKLAVFDDADTSFIMQNDPNLDDYQTETVEVSAGDKVAKDLTKQHK